MEYVPGKSFSEWGVAACVTNVFESCVSLSLSRRKPHTRLTLICKNDSDHARLTVSTIARLCERKPHTRLTPICKNVCDSHTFVHMSVSLVSVFHFRGENPTQDSHSFVKMTRTTQNSHTFLQMSVSPTQDSHTFLSLSPKIVCEKCVWVFCESFTFAQNCVWVLCESWTFAAKDPGKTHTHLFWACVCWQCIRIDVGTNMVSLKHVLAGLCEPCVWKMCLSLV